MIGNDQMLDWDGAASMLGVTPRWVRYAAGRGLLPFIKIGKHTRFDPVDLRKFVEANRQGALAADWKSECRGLGYMILDIAQKYDDARLTGGDSELLASAIQHARDYVDTSLRGRMEWEG